MMKLDGGEGGRGKDDESGYMEDERRGEGDGVWDVRAVRTAWKGRARE